MDNSAARLVLKTLSRDLNETYDRILRNIPHTRVHNAVKPLLLEEVVDALATEPDLEPPFALDNRIDPPEAIIGYCPGLVSRRRDRKRYYDSDLCGISMDSSASLRSRT
jgi:hypothetical protein